MRRVVLTLATLIFAWPAGAEPLRVFADTPVVHSLVTMVMGETGTPELLLDRGADPHSFQIRPSQARALAGADLVIWAGPGLTPWLSRTLATLSSEVPAVVLLDVEGLTLRPLGEEGHDHREDGHGHEATDPHVWLDPANAIVWISAISKALSAADPDNTPTYRRNAEDAAARIGALRAEIDAVLAPVLDRPIVVFHDAYGHFAAAFGIDVAGSLALGDATAPGAGRLRALQDIVSERGVRCVFREPSHNPAAAERLAADTGIGLGTLDPAGVTLEPGPGLYPELLRALASEIARCLADGA